MNLGECESSITIIATHFPLLTALEKGTDSFSNYNVSVNKINGDIKYPFKLEHGISNQHVALDILQSQGFAGIVVETANKIFKTGS